MGTTRYTVLDDSERRGNCIEGAEPEPGGSLGRLLQKIDATVVPGGKYRLTGWIKTTNVTSSGGVVIGVGTVNADGALIAGSFRNEIGGVKGTTGWTFFDSGDFVIPALTPGTVSHAVYLDFNGNGGGVARFDDVSLEALSNSNEAIFGSTGVRKGALAITAFLTIFASVFSALWAFRRFEQYERK